MNTVELHRWVGNVDHFMSVYWREKPVVLDVSPTTPMNLYDIDAALTSGSLRTPYVEMIRAGDTISSDAFTETREVVSRKATGFADRRLILGLMREGATLLLRNTEHWHRPTAELVARLVDELGRRVEAFFFVTPQGSQGLPVHRDDADVFLLQVSGSKLWKVRSGPENHHWRTGPVPGDPGPVILDAKLTQGQVLYIPRGYAHSAIGAQGLSAHLSLTVREIGGIDLVRAVPRLLLVDTKVPARPLDDSALLEMAVMLLESARSRLARLEPQDLIRHARESQIDQKIDNSDTESVARFAQEMMELTHQPAH
jgi:ribosomal protein L16 Arg81 hydroxylase